MITINDKEYVLSHEIRMDEREDMLIALQSITRSYGISVDQIRHLVSKVTDPDEEIEQEKQKAYKRASFCHLDFDWQDWMYRGRFQDEDLADTDYQYDRLYIAHLLDEAGLFNCYITTDDIDTVDERIYAICGNIIKATGKKKGRPAFLDLKLNPPKRGMSM